MGERGGHHGQAGVQQPSPGTRGTVATFYIAVNLISKRCAQYYDLADVSAPHRMHPRAPAHVHIQCTTALWGILYLLGACNLCAWGNALVHVNVD